MSGERFNALGESLSFDGSFVGYWGAWGSATRTVQLTCPEDGNADLIAYCRSLSPASRVKTVPVNQGIFVYDRKSGGTKLIARTGSSYLDFQFWTFSGRRPGAGDSDDSLELARWRSSAFVAVSNNSGAPAMAFKALQLAGAEGIFLRPKPGTKVRAVLLTGSDGTKLDPEAPAGSTVLTLGIERDGFRGCKLALTASAANDTTSWAGIYVVRSGACTS